MSLSDDLGDKLEAASSGLIALRLRLDKVESLEESLRNANGQLSQTSSQVSELSAAAREAQESLGLTLKALERATDVMMRLEPAVITSAIQEADTSTKAAIEDGSTRLFGLMSERTKAINQSISENHEVTRRQMRGQATKHAERQAKDVRAFKWVGSLILVALTALVVLATLTFINTRELGIGGP